jgi:hypothetical protein
MPCYQSVFLEQKCSHLFAKAFFLADNAARCLVAANDEIWNAAPFTNLLRVWRRMTM